MPAHKKVKQAPSQRDITVKDLRDIKRHIEELRTMCNADINDINGKVGTLELAAPRIVERLDAIDKWIADHTMVTIPVDAP